ncbi:YcxB family protein [Planococcus sp. ISL-109]|uniref:YcxB family protein n=1 Tax=Planococcus sp. ISL-109 TaxID=2819166 RepID=UPI001BEC2E11|nr:YcxB family protein [Planococcus sp. ISL-109]MBT2583439.1 YcxB family protein [Planococcus sp. ISL-109]
MQEFSYELTEQQFVDFNLYHAKHSKAVKRSLTVQRFLIPAIYLAMPFIMAPIFDWSVWGLMIPFVIFAALWIVFFPAYFYRIIKRTSSKMVNAGKNEGLLGYHELFIDAEGVREVTKNGETHVRWSGIEKYGQDESNVYLYNGAMSALIVPKHAVPELDSLLRLLAEKVPANAGS